LKREEVIQPKREVGRFRGEPVYRRANVLSCKTAENWMRMGRRVKDKQEPMKWVKQRAVTIQKRRAQELAIQESGEAVQQGLYAEHQTDIYRPPPIQDVGCASSTTLTRRVSSQPIPSGTSICTPRRCCLKARYTCHVGLKSLVEVTCN
jgi:hypothetical protein